MTQDPSSENPKEITRFLLELERISQSYMHR